MVEGIINKILVRASEIHASVNQFYGESSPYSVHLESVLNNALKYGNDLLNFDEYKDVIAFGACFHDTIEDARLTYNDVYKIACEYFNKDHALMAAEIVYALTNEKGRNRDERENDKYFEGVRNTPFAAFVKFCDRLANFEYAVTNKTSMAKKYYKEMPAFFDRLIKVDESDSCVTNIPKDLYDRIEELMKQFEENHA